jgi:hypothetical protein
MPRQLNPDLSLEVGTPILKDLTDQWGIGTNQDEAKIYDPNLSTIAGAAMLAIPSMSTWPSTGTT